MQNLRAEARTSLNAARLQELARVNRYLAREVLCNPIASAALLQEISVSYQDTQTRALVVRHPNCPLDLLASLGSQYPGALFDNPALPLLLLEDPNFFSRLNKYSLVDNLPETQLPLFFESWALDKQDPSLHARLAAHPCLSSSQLERLLPSTHRGVLLSVARHPNAPGWFLQQTAWGLDHALRLAVAQNKATPAALLLELTKYEAGLNKKTSLPPKPPNASPGQSLELRQALAQNPSTPPEALALLGKDFHHSLRVLVASHPNTPAETLAALALEQTPDIRLKLLRRATLPPELLARSPSLLAPEELEVLAKRPDTPASQLQDFYSRGLFLQEIVRHPAAPLAVLQDASASPSPVMRALVARHLNTPASLLEALAADAEVEVRLAAAQHPRTPPTALARLCADAARQVRHLAQRNPSAPRAFLRLLYQAGASYDLSSIRQPRRPLTSEERQALQDSGPFAVALLASTPPPARGALSSWLWRGFQRGAAEDPALQALWSAALHETREEILADFTQHENAFIRARVATNPSLPRQHLVGLSTDKQWFVRLAVALHEDTPTEVLVGLVPDRDLRVRRALARHPRLPDEARSLLLCDQRAKVRRAASSLLEFPVITRRIPPKK